MSATSSPKCNGIPPVTATATSSSHPPPPARPASVSNDYIHSANDNNNNDNVHPLIPEHMPRLCVSPSLSSVASDTLSITDVIDIKQQQANIMNTDSIMDTVNAPPATAAPNEIYSNSNDGNSNDSSNDNQCKVTHPRRRRNKKKKKDTIYCVNEDERISVDLYLNIVIEKVESAQKYVDSIMNADTALSKKKQILQRLLKDIAKYQVYEGFLEEPIWYGDNRDDPLNAKWCNAFDKWMDIYLRIKSIINN
jgi:hypothetical protein